MDLMTIVYIGVGAFLAIVLISMLIMFLKKRKTKKGSWSSAKFLEIQEFNKKHKNILDTKKIKKNSDSVFPTFYSKTKSGFLVASSKSRKIAKFPLLPDHHFSKSKYGYECDIKAYLLPKSHVMVFGSTGSGKTDTVLVPNIIFNAVCSDRPSGLVFDPKGEIYEKTAPFLVAQGYKVVNINLSSPTNSDRWSPYQFAIDSAAEHIKYAFINSLLTESGSIKNEIEAMQKTRISNARTSIEETAKILIGFSDKENSIWTNTAKAILALAGNSLLGFLIERADEEMKKIPQYHDISINSENFEKMKQEILNDTKLNRLILNNLKFLSINNVSNIVMTTTQEQWIQFLWSQGWFDKIGTFQATEDQLKSFGMNIAGALSFLVKPDFNDFISSSDFSYQDLIDKHTMIFINIPSSAEDRKSIATLMVQQIWAFLELKSKSYKGGCLPKPFNYYFEELANIPKIPCFMNILTLGRGMNIFAFVVVQSLQQFEEIYNRGSTDIVWTNTMAHLYLLAQDVQTRDFISKQCGEVELMKEDGSKIIRPLVDIEQLGEVKHGEVLILENREKPIWLNTISYENIKFFHEWERQLFGDETKKKPFDFGNKKIKGKSKGKIEKTKEKLNIKYTEPSNISILPNIISTFNANQEKKYLSFLTITLVEMILNNHDNEQMLAVIKQEIVKECQDKYNILLKNNAIKEVLTSDDDVADITNVSIDNQIYTVFVNELSKLFFSIVLEQRRIQGQKQRKEPNQRKGMRIAEDFSNFSNESQQQDLDYNIEKVRYLQSQMSSICKLLKSSKANFPYKDNDDTTKGLPSYGDLVLSASFKIMEKQDFICIAIKQYLIKINFCKNFVLNNIQELKNQERLTAEILQGEIVDSLLDSTKKKSTIDLEERILRQEAILETYNQQSFGGTELELFLKNNVQIFQRAILNYLEKIKIEPNCQLIDFLKDVKVNGFPEDLDENFNLSENYIKSFVFDSRLITISKRCNRALEAQLSAYKKQHNIRINELREKYKNAKIEVVDPSYYGNDKRFGGDQKQYYIDAIRKWLESI